MPAAAGGTACSSDCNNSHCHLQSHEKLQPDLKPDMADCRRLRAPPRQPGRPTDRKGGKKVSGQQARRGGGRPASSQQSFKGLQKGYQEKSQGVREGSQGGPRGFSRGGSPQNPNFFLPGETPHSIGPKLLQAIGGGFHRPGGAGRSGSACSRCFSTGSRGEFRRVYFSFPHQLVDSLPPPSIYRTRSPHDCAAENLFVNIPALAYGAAFLLTGAVENARREIQESGPQVRTEGAGRTKSEELRTLSAVSHHVAVQHVSLRA